MNFQNTKSDNKLEPGFNLKCQYSGLTHMDDATTDLTLLLVEDEILSREMMLLRVQGLFRHVVVAADGLEGLRRFREHAPDIVLSDQVMPGLSGLEMMREIRSEDQDSPLILITAAIDNNLLLEAINLG